MNFPLHSGLFKGHNLHTLTVFTATHIAARSSHNLRHPHSLFHHLSFAAMPWHPAQLWQRLHGRYHFTKD